jgi:hypothetical protein
MHAAAWTSIGAARSVTGIPVTLRSRRDACRDPMVSAVCSAAAIACKADCLVPDAKVQNDVTAWPRSLSTLKWKYPRVEDRSTESLKPCAAPKPLRSDAPKPLRSDAPNVFRVGHGNFSVSYGTTTITAALCRYSLRNLPKRSRFGAVRHHGLPGHPLPSDPEIFRMITSVIMRNMLRLGGGQDSLRTKEASHARHRSRDHRR